MRRRFRFVLVTVALSSFALSAVAASAADPDVLIVTESTVLDDDWYGSIRVQANDVVLDCAGHTVFGPGVAENPDFPDDTFAGIGVEALGVTVKNCNASGYSGSAIAVHGGADNATLRDNTVSGSGGGFYIGSSGNVVENNRSIGNEVDGFLIQNATDNTISSNRAEGGAVGFSLEESSGNRLTRNTVVGSENGFEIASSSDNVLEQNTALGNQRGFGIDEGSNNSFTNNESHRNTEWGFQESSNAGINAFSKNYCTGNLLGGSDPSGLCQEERVGLVDTSQGMWHLRHNPDDVTSFFYGNPGDIPFMGDWDCDGISVDHR